CMAGNYGANCTLFCSRLCKDHDCDKTSGQCRACMNGQPPNCTDCPGGTYGSKCSLTCPQFCDYNICDIHLGQCFGCQEGKILPFCLDLDLSVDPAAYHFRPNPFWLTLIVPPLVALFACLFVRRKKSTREHAERAGL
ncbi:unnamed protein product, partial [Candidula unifasciata]